MDLPDTDHTPSQRTRDLDGTCDECGKEEGSMLTDREAGWTLCREHANDPEVLADHAE